MFKPLLILLALAGLATACRKGDEEPTIDFGPNNGFSMRTPTNLPTGQNDPTDWTHDATWSSTEQSLFATLGLALGSPAQQGGSWFSSVYPNPVKADGRGNFALLFASGSQSTPVTATVRVKLVVVDAKYNVLDTTDQLVGTGTTVALSFPLAKYPADKLYRVYYAVYEPTQKTVYYWGHGDVEVEN